MAALFGRCARSREFLRVFLKKGAQMKLFLPVLFVCGIAAYAQDMLNDESIVKMVKAGLSEDLIVSMIKNQPGKHTLTADDVVKMKGQGVTEKELGAMITKGSAPAASAPASGKANGPAVAIAGLDLPEDLEIGVYYKKAGKWQEMLPEVVNWKTGGVVKNIASAGMIKGDVNGHIQGTNSRNSLASPVEVVIYAPEGVAITEYQLLHLRDHADAREFRTVTGGVMHVSGGAVRDVVPFEGTKLANRIYKVVLPSLGAGEYGFLPPGAFGAANSASIGKMYTFRVIE
jgi:hypothetical protein